MKGKRYPAEVREHMGRPEGFRSELKGRKRTNEDRQAISRAVRNSPRTLRGVQCHSYRDGKVAERRDARFSMEYKHWRYDVFCRDHFTCQISGGTKGRLVAHHIKAFANFPELRFALSNGITLSFFWHEIIEALKYCAKKGVASHGRTNGN
jgi:hypothetical protein